MEEKNAKLIQKLADIEARTKSKPWTIKLIKARTKQMKKILEDFDAVRDLVLLNNAAKRNEELYNDFKDSNDLEMNY